ncbi:MAG: dacB [Ferruginibacter sp.]|nr:dacB [Ferruginibacter sp.]
MNIIPFAIALLFALPASSQDLQANLQYAITALENDPQLKHGTIALYVVDRDNGQLVFEKNAQTGMAPASCQKIITSAAAYELLGKGYRYKTLISTNAHGDIVFQACGDPTLGSWRWKQTDKPEQMLADIFRRNNIYKINGDIVVKSNRFAYQPLPDGWIWQDIGNYYGAGAWGLNWHENQYDLNLSSGDKVGSATTILSTTPVNLKTQITNLIVAGAKGSGDNGYIYSAPYQEKIYTTGTIPAGEKKFTISGSMPNPPLYFAQRLQEIFAENKMAFSGKLVAVNPATSPFTETNYRLIDSIVSPPLDSINYWFLKKSVNLFGEALVKTIALEKEGIGNTDQGVSLIRKFWSTAGIEPSAIKIADGSGLSPGNRVTADALVTVLQFARKADWFSSFYFALPEMNGIKMKDGYINGVRSYAGYIDAKNGKHYSFAFLVNNFDGSAGTVREKMWKVLDLLK